MSVEIRAIADGDVDAAVALRQRALREEPLAFAASPERDFGSEPESVRARIADAPASVMFGAFDGGALVGLASVFRETHRKRAHRTNVYGMYVAPTHRRRGIALRLLEAAALHAETNGAAWLSLSVSTAAPGARRLYEGFGFVAWGDEPDALRDGGESVSELHLSLALPRDRG